MNTDAPSSSTSQLYDSIDVSLPIDEAIEKLWTARKLDGLADPIRLPELDEFIEGIEQKSSELEYRALSKMMQLYD